MKKKIDVLHDVNTWIKNERIEKKNERINEEEGERNKKYQVYDKVLCNKKHRAQRNETNELYNYASRVKVRHDQHRNSSSVSNLL